MTSHPRLAEISNFKKWNAFKTVEKVCIKSLKTVSGICKTNVELHIKYCLLNSQLFWIFFFFYFFIKESQGTLRSLCSYCLMYQSIPSVTISPRQPRGKVSKLGKSDHLGKFSVKCLPTLAFPGYLHFDEFDAFSSLSRPQLLECLSANLYGEYVLINCKYVKIINHWIYLQ